MSHSAIARALGIPLSTYFTRLGKGQDPTVTRPRYRRRKGDSKGDDRWDVLNAVRFALKKEPIERGWGGRREKRS